MYFYIDKAKENFRLGLPADDTDPGVTNIVNCAGIDALSGRNHEAIRAAVASDSYRLVWPPTRAQARV